jgi:riboflavin synthase
MIDIIMFTGIVQGKGTVKAIHTASNFRSLEIELPRALTAQIIVGASIAINGTCLTVTGQNNDLVRFDVIGQTLKLTNLGDLVSGSEVNIERSLKFGDEIGGHILSGHITSAIAITKIERQNNNRTLYFKLPNSLAKYILPQGFIGLDGCSLTVASVQQDSFSICLIPETLNCTCFDTAKVGQRINLEIDHQTQTIVTTVENLVKQRFITNHLESN